ncbi:uridylate kinase, partial [Tanacetum coccineum]
VDASGTDRFLRRYICYRRMNENGTSRGPVKLQRVLLKVSGEALAGDREQNIDPNATMAIAKGVDDVTRLGIEVAILTNLHPNVLIIVNAEVFLKATNVDGVYEEDPMSNPNTQLHDTLTCQEVISRDLCVMDLAAITLYQENNILEGHRLKYDKLERMNENGTSRGPVKWKRVLLKVSGEAFTSDREQNIDPNVTLAIAKGVDDVTRLGIEYICRRAIRHLKKGRVIFTAETENPFSATDTVAAIPCAEINAEVFLKATNVDGVYEEDPMSNPNTRLHDTLTCQEVISRDLCVMDSAAITLYQENNILATEITYMLRVTVCVHRSGGSICSGVVRRGVAQSGQRICFGYRGP